MSDLSIYQFRRQIGEATGVDVTDLGFVGLNTNKIDILQWVPERLHSDLIYSVEDRPWINGPTAAKNPHTTLIYGLTKPAYSMKKLIHTLLDDLSFKPARIKDISEFGNSQDPYTCLVGELERSDDLVEANRRLRWLPHIDTYIEYKPHITLAYILKENVDEWRRIFDREVRGLTVTFRSLDYGNEEKTNGTYHE